MGPYESVKGTLPPTGNGAVSNSFSMKPRILYFMEQIAAYNALNRWAIATRSGGEVVSSDSY